MRFPNLTNGFVVLALLLSTGAFLPLLIQESGNEGPTQIVWLGVYAIVGFLILARWKRFIHVVTRDKFLLLLIMIALLSVFWSAAPEATIRRSMSLLGTTLLGAYLATRYSVEELLRLLAWALGLAVLFSLAFALAFPSYGVVTGTFGYYEGEEGWRGIYGEKNALGAAMALGAGVFFFLALGRPRHHWTMWAFFGLSIGVLLLANAKTALLSFLILLILFPFYKALRWQYNLIVPLFVVTILMGGTAVVWVLDNAQILLNTLGRDATLTGRTEIWPAVIESARQRPLLGYGYGGFWLGWEGESSKLWLRTAALFGAQNIGPSHAHNGFLDLWLNLGLLGVSMFVLSLLRGFSRAVTWARSTRTVEGFWPLAYLTLILIYASADFPILTHNSIWWVLYVAVVLSVSNKAVLVRSEAFRGVPMRRMGSLLVDSPSIHRPTGPTEPSSARRRR